VNQNDASHGRSTEVADYVLGNFKKEEKSLIDDKMGEIEKYILEFIQR
jgi:peptidyl-tRNA hydrolase